MATPEEMEENAFRAAPELQKLADQHPEAIKALADFWRAQVPLCGHKRLGRMVVDISKRGGVVTETL